jgi:hypothetical protein
LLPTYLIAEARISTRGFQKKVFGDPLPPDFRLFLPVAPYQLKGKSNAL